MTRDSERGEEVTEQEKAGLALRLKTEIRLKLNIKTQSKEIAILRQNFKRCVRLKMR